MNKTRNKLIWNRRYKNKSRLAKWPYDTIVSLTLKLLKSDINKKTKVLDYGCGIGNHIWFLNEEGFDAYGCDTSAQAVKHCIKYIKSKDCNFDSQKIKHIKNTRFPFSSLTFSAVIDRASLCQSSWKQMHDQVSEIKRVLKCNGYYFGINFSCHHPDIKIAKLIKNGDFDRFKRGLFKNQGQRHLFSINEILELFSDWKHCSIVNSNKKLIWGHDYGLDTDEYIVVAKK